MDKALQGYADILGWLPQAIADGEAWLTPNPDFETFRAIVASMPEVIDVPEATLKRLTVPVFGLVGSEDPERTTIERFAGLLPGVTLEILLDTDHPGSSEHPDLPKKKIHDFLTSVEGRLSFPPPQS